MRYPWAKDYRGAATVVYGHTPVPTAEWVNNTICLDTGCVFGGALTALRYPERELVSVPAEQDLLRAGPPAALRRHRRARRRELLDIGDVDRATRWIETGVRPATVKVREENAAAALEVMGRFAVDPRWLLYLPPTMAPSPTSDSWTATWSTRPRRSTTTPRAASTAWCARRSTWARAPSRCWPDAERAERRFGVADGGTGAVYTRTGRPFFDDTGRRWSAGCARRRAAALRRAGHRLAAARQRAAAVVGQGARR